jgi:hypothetical protein
MILLLRYGTSKPTLTTQPILNHKVIAKTLELSSYTIRSLIKFGLETKCKIET